MAHTRKHAQGLCCVISDPNTKVNVVGCAISSENIEIDEDAVRGTFYASLFAPVCTRSYRVHSSYRVQRPIWFSSSLSCALPYFSRFFPLSLPLCLSLSHTASCPRAEGLLAEWTPRAEDAESSEGA